MTGKVIRLTPEVYKELESCARGFETPSQTLARILKEYKELKKD